MVNIQRKIYFDISTGNVIIDTGERSGDVVDTSTEQDFAIYAELSIRVPETVGMVSVPFGSESEKFAKYLFHIDPATLEIVWDLTSDQRHNQEVQKTLEDKLLDMENQNNLLRQSNEALDGTVNGLIDFLSVQGVI